MKNVYFFSSIVLCILALICNSCKSNSSLETRIGDYIQRNCHEKDDCLIKIKDVTDFEWQKMYVFKEGVTLEKINEVLGFEYPYFEDIARRTVFVSGNRITYHEDIFPNPESVEVGQVIYKMPDTVQYTVLRPDEAIFKINIVELEQGAYYILTK